MLLHPHQERYTLKSFTHNQSNLLGLRADKRFEQLVKKQEMEHQHLISSHHREMQELRDSLIVSIQRFESLSERCEAEIKDLKSYIHCMLGTLNTKININELSISEQKKTIEDAHLRLHEFHIIYSSKQDSEKNMKDMHALIKETTFNHLISIQALQTELKDLFKSLKDDFENHKQQTGIKFSTLIDQVEKNFHMTKIDREGVLREVRIWDKTIFIIEKKLENIYTLIDRINKRSESCLKQE